MTTESFNISYRYVKDSGEIETEIKTIGLAPSQKQAKISLSLPGSSKPEIDIDVMVDPMNPVGYLPELSGQELKRRLPEIQYIENNALREQVIELLLAECPEHYWTYPASTSGNHHPMDERTIHGQWIHTKRMFSAFKYISESPRKTANTNNILDKFGISKHERECGLAASLTHDIFKFGRSEKTDYTLENHDTLAAEYLSDNYEFPDTFIQCIDSYNGPWKDGKHPEKTAELLFHYSDIMASDMQSGRILFEPAQELLLPTLIQDINYGIQGGEKYTIHIANST